MPTVKITDQAGYEVYSRQLNSVESARYFISSYDWMPYVKMIKHCHSYEILDDEGLLIDRKPFNQSIVFTINRMAVQGPEICEIPRHMHAGIFRYVVFGVPPGDFLQAIFGNDFVHAASRADEQNIESLKQYCMYLYNYAPRQCWGSIDSVTDWCKSGGLNGIFEKEQTHVHES